jgi:hypothetical protein
MPRPSPFADDWHDTLKNQFMRVARAGNDARLQSIMQLMLREGYSQEAINALYLEATLRTEDVDPDFVPDLDILDLKRAERAAHSAECSCPRCAPT